MSFYSCDLHTYIHSILISYLQLSPTKHISELDNLFVNYVFTAETKIQCIMASVHLPLILLLIPV